MHRKRLTPGPGIAYDGGLTYVHDLLDDVELAQPAVSLFFAGEQVQLR